jgi:hypothetical protein
MAREMKRYYADCVKAQESRSAEAPQELLQRKQISDGSDGGPVAATKAPSNTSGHASAKCGCNPQGHGGLWGPRRIEPCNPVEGRRSVGRDEALELFLRLLFGFAFVDAE